MGDFNKVLSFFLGLVVVIVFVIVLANRLNLRGKLLPFQTKNTSVTATPTRTPTPTPTGTKKQGNFLTRLFGKGGQTPTPTPTEEAVPTATPTPESATSVMVIDRNKGAQTNSKANQPQQGGQPTNQIPSTGIPVVLYPIAFSSLYAGLKLRKTS